MQHFISVMRRTIRAADAAAAPDGPGAAFVLSGEVHLGPEKIGAATGAFLGPGAAMRNGSADTATVLIFAVTPKRPDADVLGCEEISGLSFPRLLRLDEVSFPPGAIAYRHTHPGPGFRYLRHGALHLQSDSHGFDAAPGTHWFEPAEAPVRATASDQHRETRFVRFMALPPAFLGKPTINILDPGDAARPRRQTTHRHVDRIVDQAGHVDAG